MSTWDELARYAGRNDKPAILVRGALLDGDLEDPDQIAIGIEDAWTGCEWPGIAFDEDDSGDMSQRIWNNLFNKAFDGDEDGYLLGDQLAKLDTLPETIMLYRGCSKGHEYGMSWTTSFERAHWFATRMSALWGGGEVYRIYAPREWVLADFGSSQRGEDEIVIDPTRLLEDDLERIDPAEYPELLAKS